jgi:hypothetical protein
MEKIQARLILEILGRPKEHVSEALKMIVDKISKEKGVRLVETQIHAPMPIKESTDLFTSFTEIVIECDTLSSFFGIVFAYMPANIEIMEPLDLQIRNDEFTALANRIIQRLHNYDAIARKLVVDNKMLREKLGIPEPATHAQQQQSPAQVPKKEKKSKATKKKKKK